MREIATTHPFFVRCIKPNNTLKPNEFLPALVLRQLQCSGTCECVKLMQTGYPSRAPYRDLRARFKAYLPDFMDSMAELHDEEEAKAARKSTRKSEAKAAPKAEAKAAKVEEKKGGGKKEDGKKGGKKEEKKEKKKGGGFFGKKK